MKPLRLALVDNSPEILESASELLNDEFSIVGLFTDGSSLLQHSAALNPDIIILDISLGDSSGFDVARRLRHRGFKAEILFLTVHEGEEFVKAGFEAGGSGFILKSRLHADLLPAIHAVANHELFVSEMNM